MDGGGSTPLLCADHPPVQQEAKCTHAQKSSDARHVEDAGAAAQAAEQGPTPARQGSAREPAKPLTEQRQPQQSGQSADATPGRLRRKHNVAPLQLPVEGAPVLPRSRSHSRTPSITSPLSMPPLPMPLSSALARPPAAFTPADGDEIEAIVWAFFVDLWEQFSPDAALAFLKGRAKGSESARRCSTMILVRFAPYSKCERRVS
jgi:hypothetical protein